MIITLPRSSFLLIFIAALPFAAAEEKKEGCKFDISKDEQKIMDLINKERVKANLPELKPHPLLFKAARGHAANMAKQRKMEHVLNGKRPAQRVEDAGYDWGKVRENILTADMLNVPPVKLVKAWMESKDHRVNILANDVTETGLGIASNTKGEVYYTQIFARKRRVKK